MNHHADTHRLTLPWLISIVGLAVAIVVVTTSSGLAQQRKDPNRTRQCVCGCVYKNSNGEWVNAGRNYTIPTTGQACESNTGTPFGCRSLDGSTSPAGHLSNCYEPEAMNPL